MAQVYRVNSMMLTITGLKAFEFVKETEKTIWYMEYEDDIVSSKKFGNKYRFFHSFDEAKEHAINCQTKIVEEYRQKYEQTVDCLTKIKERTK